MRTRLLHQSKVVVYLGLLVAVFLFQTSGYSASKLACAFLLGEMEVTGALIIFRDKEGALVEGSIVLELPRKAGPRFYFPQLNLTVPRGVRISKGNTGVIGLVLLKSPAEVEYDETNGRIYAKFQVELHYPFIDRIRGFKEVEEQGNLQTSLLHRAHGRRVGRQDLGRSPGGKEISLEGKTSFSLSRSILGEIRDIEIPLKRFELFCGAQRVEVLKIQQVFIRRGRESSGGSFSELMCRAQGMWSRCGDVRCITFQALSPRYINNPDCWVIDSKEEAKRLARIVDVPDSVEVFVAAEFARDLALRTGGGWC